MAKLLDLNKHVSLTATHAIGKILKPLTDILSIKHFRYLKLYHDGSRSLLTNHPDCLRYMYEEGNYRKMWYDGNFPEFLKEDWYYWKINRLLDDSDEEIKLEQDINNQLELYHGVTYVKPGIHCYEIFSFDTKHADIYTIDKKLLYGFMLYFKCEAKKLLQQAEAEKFFAPLAAPLEKPISQETQSVLNYLQEIKINRYYLSGAYSNIYLTSKELKVVYWLIQGKTVEEIALIESSHIKTIRSHFDNIKLKLNCQKQTQIVKIVLENDLFKSNHFF